MESTMEVLTTRRGRVDAHRQWPDDIKAQIVSESLRLSIGVVTGPRIGFQKGV